jgi:hypothetical protein
MDASQLLKAGLTVRVEIPPGVEWWAGFAAGVAACVAVAVLARWGRGA